MKKGKKTLASMLDQEQERLKAKQLDLQAFKETCNRLALPEFSTFLSQAVVRFRSDPQLFGHKVPNHSILSIFFT